MHHRERHGKLHRFRMLHDQRKICIKCKKMRISSKKAIFSQSTRATTHSRQLQRSKAYPLTKSKKKENVEESKVWILLSICTVESCSVGVVSAYVCVYLPCSRWNLYGK